MLNEHLFDDKKDIEIARLKKVIEDFKEYDEKRKRYYAEKMRRLGELESLLCEINESKDKADLRKVILNQKKAITDLSRIISVRRIEESRTSEELGEIVNSYQLKKNNKELKKRIKELQATVKELIAKVVKLEEKKAI